MKKIMFLFAGIMLLACSACGEKPVSAPFQQIMQDEFFLCAEMGDEEVFYLVEQGKERKRLASDVECFLFLENSKSILYVDGESQLCFQRKGKEKEIITGPGL